jgi:hypothetical protein
MPVFVGRPAIEKVEARDHGSGVNDRRQHHHHRADKDVGHRHSLFPIITASASAGGCSHQLCTHEVSDRVSAYLRLAQVTETFFSRAF